MSAWTESCSPASPTSTPFTIRTFFSFSASSTPTFLYLITLDKSGLQQVASPARFPFSVKRELCLHAVGRFGPLFSSFQPCSWHLVSLSPRYTAVSPTMLLGFLSWHQAHFSAANIAQSFLHCFLLAAILSLLHCSFSASSTVPICLLAFCISL